MSQFIHDITPLFSLINHFMISFLPHHSCPPYSKERIHLYLGSQSFVSNASYIHQLTPFLNFQLIL